MIELVRNVDKNKLRNFGLTFSLILTIVAFLLFRKYRPSFVYFYTISCVVALLSILSPRLLSGLYKTFTVIGSVIGKINATLILSLIFYLIFTPVGIFCKIFHIDLLDERIDKESPSYWKKKEKASFNKNHYERLY